MCDQRHGIARSDTESDIDTPQKPHGPSLLSNAGPVPPVELSGKTLLDMAVDDYRDPLTLQQSRALMRFVLNHYLGGQVLHTRQLLRDMQQI